MTDWKPKNIFILTVYTPDNVLVYKCWTITRALEIISSLTGIRVINNITILETNDFTTLNGQEQTIL